MLNELSCLHIDWTAIAAVVTACAAVVALWVGLEPRRLQIKHQKQRAAAAAGLLLLELRAASVAGTKLTEAEECLQLCSLPGRQAYARESLVMPLLKVCTTSAEIYPEKVALLMGSVCATTSGLRSAIEAMAMTNSLNDENLNRMKELAQTVVRTTYTLELELMSYLPERKRSVSKISPNSLE